jgi:2-keto-4-pentenoate hydratase/2-oxohepta-3-ene-1,7-dioic acid hydratase in catechol pathway
MRICNIFHSGDVRAAFRLSGGPRVLVRDLDRSLPQHVEGLLAGGHLPRLGELAGSAAGHVPPVPEDAPVTAPVRHAGKLLGVGLNYAAHAEDLTAPRPHEPAIFIKAGHTVIGPGEPIPLPPQSERVTAEAELALVIGAPAWQVEEADALACVAGVVPVLDQTAEDILQRNPRFLVRAKNFPGFLSLGPELVTTDEVMSTFGTMAAIEVETGINDTPHRRNTVSNMLFSPECLVSFVSHVMPLEPGDVLCTGTPGAVAVASGDEVACRIDGIGELRNPVR